jgi:pilus assembly protein CpaC
MRRLVDLRIFCLLFFVVAIAWSPAKSNQVIRETSGVIGLEIGKGVLIRLAKPASTVFIANPKIADIQVKSPRLIYLLAKKTGETTLIAVDENERVLANRRLRVSHNLSQLRESLKSFLPTDTIDVRSVGSSIVVSGSVRSAIDAAEIRRLAEQQVAKPENVILKVGVTEPTQVQLRVRIAEVSRDVLKQFGINWDALVSVGDFVFGLATGTIVNTSETFLDGLATTTVRNGGTNSLYGSYKGSSVDINGLIDALNNEGFVTVLAQPNLTALSGKPATFLAGGEFPIVVPDTDNRVAIEFKQFGVSLGFTPTILSKDRISLYVNPEVSQLSSAGAVQLAGFSVPALTTRRAETTVELGNGQSFAIAGLLQNNIRHDISKFPGLGDVPILGSLFRSNRFQRNETELVIIVTPYIVRPTAAASLAAPTDGLTPPTDEDRILHGRLYRPSPRSGEKGPVPLIRRQPRGSMGFVLD